MGLEGREEPENQTDIDRRFAQIIAQFGPDEDAWDPADPTVEDEQDEQPADDHDGSDQLGVAAPASLADLPTQWRMPPSGSESLLDDEEDTFVPAPPRPLPSGEEDIGFWTMLGALVGGPLWLLYLFFFDRYAPSLWWVLACALFVAGVLQLILRSPKNRDDDPDDDGAVL